MIGYERSSRTPPGLVVGLDDVEGLVVRGNQQAVGAGGVEGHLLAGVGTIRLRVGAEDVAAVHLRLLAGVDVAGVPRVAEPDATLPVDGQVVGRVQPLVTQAVDDGGCGAIFVESDYGSPAGAAPVQPALGVESQPVGVVGVLPVDGALARVGMVGHDSALGDVSEQQASAVPGGAFGQAAEGSGDVLPLQCHVVLLDQVWEYRFIEPDQRVSLNRR